MSTKDIMSIFEQIDNLNIETTIPHDEKTDNTKWLLKEILIELSEEIQRVLDQNNFTQEDLCRITGMSQSNISKIQNGKVAPRIETLLKIASATHTRLVICFEDIQGEE